MICTDLELELLVHETLTIGHVVRNITASKQGSEREGRRK